MKSGLLALVAALLLSASSTARAVTFGLPLNGTVFFNGPANSTVIPQVNINFSAAGPSVNPPCSIVGPGTDACTALEAAVSVGSFISQYDRDGNLVATAILAEFFSNTRDHHIAGEFGLSLDESVLDSTLANLPSFSLVISTGVRTFRNATIIPSPTDPLTITLADGFTETVTPLPAALPLFATGLGALVLLARHKGRKADATKARRSQRIRF
jgi:hypothetical protein